MEDIYKKRPEELFERFFRRFSLCMSLSQASVIRNGCFLGMAGHLFSAFLGQVGRRVQLSGLNLPGNVVGQSEELRIGHGLLHEDTLVLVQDFRTVDGTLTRYVKVSCGCWSRK